MKIFFVILVLLLTGCSNEVRYDSRENADRNQWTGMHSSPESAKAELLKKVREKIERSEQNITEDGYLGIIINKNDSDECTISLSGPEIIGFHMRPLQEIKHRLLPGKYRAKINRGSRYIDSVEFTVGPRTHQIYDIKDIHYYVVTWCN